MFYLNQWKDAFKSESFTAKNIRTDRQTEVLPVGKKHYAVIVALPFPSPFKKASSSAFASALPNSVIM